MKVIGCKSKSVILVEMKVKELIELTGFGYYKDFNSAFGVDTNYSDEIENLDKLLNVEGFPVSDIYKNAKETLSSYEELRTKFESIRNQLSALLKKMAILQPQGE